MKKWSVFMVAILAFCSPSQVTPQECPSSCSCHPNFNPAYPSGLMVNCSESNQMRVPDDVPVEAATLLLSHNRLTKLSDNIFLHLKELKELDLSYNVISVLHSDAFRGLGKLTKLNLCSNKLPLRPQTYPADVFRPLVSLTSLWLHGNVVRSIRFARKSRKPTKALSSRANVTTKSSLLFAPLARQLNIAKDKHLEVESRMSDSPTIGSAGTTDNSARTFFSTDHIEVLDYPDQALSHLHSLTNLSIDGLPNRRLGSGFKNLTRLTSLDMNGERAEGHCNLSTLSKDTLVSVPYVRYLNLSSCNIANLTTDTFGSLNVLETLDLSFNKILGFDLLGDAFCGLSNTSLQNLIIDNVVPTRSPGITITSRQLRCFGNLTVLENLQARFNRIRGFDDTALRIGMPPNLSHINVDGNMFELDSYVNDVDNFGALQWLDMNGFDDSWIPPLRPPDEDQLGYKSRKILYKRSVARTTNILHALDPRRGTEVGMCLGKQFSVPPFLKNLTVADFGLQYKLKRVKVNPNNHLKRIDMSRNHFPSLEGPLCGFENMTELILVETMTEDINHEFFDSLSSLEILILSRNSLGDPFKYNTDGKLLGGLKNLKKLDISFNNIGHLPEKTLVPLENLEELDVSVNGIGTFTFDLSHMTKLKHLDISKNPMHTIPQAARAELDHLAENHNVTVNMTYNPISCTCENIDFLKWIRDSKVYFGTHRNYYCQFAGGYEKFMIDIKGVIDELDRTCGSYVGVFVAASAGCLTMMVLLTVALAYRFRWKLRYLYYATRLGLQRQHPQERQKEFHYDAFVSFSSEDDDFVNGELKQRLEDEFGLELCIHTRDFVPGQYIASNIVDSVQRSRRTLVVLTRALLESDWCRYELQMALMEAAHTGRDVLLFLLYEHVPTHEMSREVLANLQAASYLEFPHNEQDKSLFWRRLAQALRS